MVALKNQLGCYDPRDPLELMDKGAMLALLNAGDGCFLRTHPWAHFTGSALLLSADMKRVLLNHHRFLDMWLQFGGHADGNPDLFDVACREVAEESGFTRFVPVMNDIFDISIHPIPANLAKGEPAHLHYDVRYLFRLETADENFVISEESVDLKWCSFDEAMSLTCDKSVVRMLEKWHALTPEP